MKIGIIIYSQSGATANVAKKLDAALTAGGHEVDTTLLRTTGKVKPRDTSVEIKNAPSVEPFDAIVVAGPVWAFTISPVILKYVKGLGKLTGKKALCFVTKGLPFAWTGGTTALKTLENELSLSGATICPGELIHTGKARSTTALEPYIARMVESLTE